MSRVRFIQPVAIIIIRTVSSKKYVYRCTYSMMLYLYVVLIHAGTFCFPRPLPGHHLLRAGDKIKNIGRLPEDQQGKTQGQGP